MQIDFSRGTAIHRLYGHGVFMIEAEKQNKPENLKKAVCEGLKCDGVGTPNDWRLNRL